jgi:glycosyltransferase involved in cell wall biosynthesis
MRKSDNCKFLIKTGNPAKIAVVSDFVSQPVNFLWVIDFEFEKRLHHGALLRYFNFAPELIAQGHTVIFAVNFLDLSQEPAVQYFQELRHKGVVTDFFEANFKPSLWRIRLGARLIHPRVANAILRADQRRFATKIDAVAREKSSNVVLVSSTRLFFLPLRSRSGCAFIYDIADCHTFYARRQIRVLVKNRDVVGLVRVLRSSMSAYAQERYYSRLPVMKIMVSPADKQAIDKISGKPRMSAVVLNGVRHGVKRGQYPKIPGRIIFTGNMDFPPNYEAALWFLDHVFPRLLRQRSDTCFVIAGANPIQALLEYKSKNVVITGYIEDLNREIACSEIFVAPLISGGGFKNKVVEAIVNRTSVVATSIAVEFFDTEIRGLLKVADSPASMIEAITDIWRNPLQTEALAERLHELVSSRFSWAGRAAQIAELSQRAMIESPTND